MIWIAWMVCSNGSSRPPSSDPPSPLGRGQRPNMDRQSSAPGVPSKHGQRRPSQRGIIRCEWHRCTDTGNACDSCKGENQSLSPIHHHTAHAGQQSTHHRALVVAESHRRLASHIHVTGRGADQERRLDRARRAQQPWTRRCLALKWLNQP